MVPAAIVILVAVAVLVVLNVILAFERRRDSENDKKEK